MLVLPGNVRFRRNPPVLNSNHQDLSQKLNHIAEMPSDIGNPSIYVYSWGGGVCPKISIELWPFMIDSP